ncbi:Fe(3+)-hydroxamate ABC transporter permease FhuB [Vibrio sp. SCSIO 43136]|uniref:Fe(3+)-hydroxamate ABC transporter permease FhuB n=1 Tax=Vibrio sp. SCSIO 43136 TaxID=2819101 RepID=UPI002075DFEF|nr:Fe(3+)-hydroxamate ABC transporter permease FhuB [Vibrio sp. SCSIO 43136]USD66047.1 Fe(3+)-hydroxamate ABC transporter permease FhuB [Vibrio sp. SCSIO 43136]
MALLKNFTLALLVVMLLILSSSLGSELTLSQQLSTTAAFLSAGDFIPEEFEQILFIEAQLPRLVMTIIVGALLGLVGSTLQQLTQNNLVSPLTLGTTAGGWLALVVAGVWLPSLLSQYGTLVTFVGAITSLSIVILIVGLKNLSGMPIILAGMAVNILFGAIATGVVLLNDQYTRNLFIWGAGDLAQNGWEAVRWIIPHLVLVIPLLLFAPRVLTLLRLGQTASKARGLSIVPAYITLLGASLWLTSAAIAHVGVISFIGLIAPNIVRALGHKTPKAELLYSSLLGAGLLLLTDCFAQYLSSVSINIVPTGTAAALIGAPILIALVRKQLKAHDQLSLKLPESRFQFNDKTIGALLALILASIIVTVFIAGDSWQLEIPNAFTWEHRWPRMVAALSAGLALAVAGTVLQRVIYNPLASPDILGISSGASLFLVMGFLVLGTNSTSYSVPLALAGSFIVLIALLWLVRSNGYRPSIVILTGISLSALVDSLIQLVLAQGNETAYVLLIWLSGSTYQVTAKSAIILALSSISISALLLSLQRWLTLISSGRSFAASRGLNVSTSFVLLVSLVAILTALVTALLGPIGFVGLLAPHIAVMLGARQARQQLIVAGLVGAALLNTADWLGQVILYPSQIAAGTLVSILGGSYFLFLLVQGRRKSR